MPPARRGASSPNSPATPSEPTAATPAAKPAARKPAARKPAAAKTAAAKPAASRAAAKPAAAKPAAAKPAAARAAAAKPAAAKPAAAKSAAAAKPAAKSAAAKKPAAKKAAPKKAADGPMVKAARDAQAAAEERFEAVAKRLRKLNDQIIEAARDRSETTLDSYEKALKAIANGIEKGPGKSDVDWIANLASSQAKFIRDVTKSMADAARDAIKK